MKRSLVLLLLLVAGLILLLLLSAVGFAGRGRMPSESVAVGVRKDALQYIESYSTNNAAEAKIPASISGLKPIRVEHYNGGLLLVLRERFVEEYGYYFCADTNLPPADISTFCDRVSPGLFRYYNPG